MVTDTKDWQMANPSNFQEVKKAIAAYVNYDI